MTEPTLHAALPRHARMRRHLLGGGLALCTGSLLPLAAGARTPSSSAGFYGHFDGARLVDQEGRAFTPARLAGRLVLVDFIFTACSTACPVKTAALAGLQRQLPPALGPRVHLLSVSLDPLNDTPKALKAFAQRAGVDLAGWTFATGRPQDIERLSDALRLFRPGSPVRKPDDHSTAVWLIDGAGDLRMRYAGSPPDVPRLLRELAALDQLERGPQSR
jgi:protein SCO1